jgi:hypothetical protein
MSSISRLSTVLPRNSRTKSNNRLQKGKKKQMENGASGEGRDPSGFLSEIIGAPVTVKLNSGVVYKGIILYHLGY